MNTNRACLARRCTSLFALLFTLATLLGLAGCHGGQPTAWSTSLLARTDKFFGAAHVTGDTFVVVGYAGRILRTEDAGSTWADVDSGVIWSLNNVSFSGEHGWAVGHNGAVIHSRDGGKTWAPQTADTDKTLMAVSFVDQLHGWACGDESTWMWTDNGGETWNVERMDVSQIGLSEFTSLAVPDIIYYSVQFLDKNTGWIVGEYGNVRYTTDGGKTWGAQHDSLLDELVEQGGVRDVMVMGAFFKVHFSDPSNGVMVGAGGAIAKTSDGGQRWTWIAREGSNADVPALHLYDVDTPGENARLVLAGMNAVVLDTTDSGANWGPTQTPDGVYTWINSVAFGENGKGVLVGGKGTIMITGDGGKSWELVEQEVAEEEAAAH